MAAGIVGGVVEAASLIGEKPDINKILQVVAGLTFGPLEREMLKLLTLLSNGDYVDNMMGNRLRVVTGFTSYYNAPHFAKDYIDKSTRTTDRVKAWMKVTTPSEENL